MVVELQKPKKKKVLIVATVSGFLPQFEMSRVKILQLLGYEVHFASNFRCPHYGQDNQRLENTGICLHQIDFVRTPYRITANIKAYQQVCQLLKTEYYSIIHCHTPMGGCLTRLAAIKQYHTEQTRIIYTAHGFHFYKGAPLINWFLYYPMEYILAYFTDALITITKEDYIRAKFFKTIPPKNIYYIPGIGVSVQNSNDMGRKECRKELGYNDNQFVLLSVGELNSNKNHEFVLNALSCLKNKNICYAVCGEGTARKKLEKKIRREDLGENVKLFGYQQDIPKFLVAADVFIIPSIREGISISLLEAMNMGLPVIATNIRGNCDLIVGGKGGWLIKLGDVRGLCTAIRDVITLAEKGSILLSQMCEFNKMKAKQFNTQTVNKKMMKIYMEEQKK